MSSDSLHEFLSARDLLALLIEETNKNDATARQVVDGLSEEQLNWKPATDRWSMAECLDHLSISELSFKPYLADAIARGRQRFPVNAPPPYLPSMMGGWLARALVPENTGKMKAPQILQPFNPSAILGAIDRFLGQQAELRHWVVDARGIDYNKTRLRSPVTRLVRYSVADAYVVMVVHARRHLGQAARVRLAPGFPI